MTSQDSMEKIAFLKAAKTSIDQELKDCLAEARQDLLELYETYGVSQLEVTVQGQKVGTFSVTHNAASTRSELVVKDKVALFGNKLYDPAQFLREHAQEYAEWLCRKNGGEIPSGCEVETYEIPASIGTPTLRGCKPSEVFSLMIPELPTYIAGLIEGAK